MKAKQRILSPSFRAKVALAAFKSDMTIAEMSSRFSVHATQINRWKKLLIDGVTGLIEDPRRKAKDDHDKELIDQLYKQIGQLTVENDWLKKKAGQLF